MGAVDVAGLPHLRVAGGEHVECGHQLHFEGADGCLVLERPRRFLEHTPAALRRAHRLHGLVHDRPFVDRHALHQVARRHDTAAHGPLHGQPLVLRSGPCGWRCWRGQPRAANPGGQRNGHKPVRATGVADLFLFHLASELCGGAIQLAPVAHVLLHGLRRGRHGHHSPHHVGAREADLRLPAMRGGLPFLLDAHPQQRRGHRLLPGRGAGEECRPRPLRRRYRHCLQDPELGGGRKRLQLSLQDSGNDCPFFTRPADVFQWYHRLWGRDPG
mmetsp:Transcript_123585/g.384749  ORF Transcript_123585/g.384749 Transcript_123585/m.384749 type:complete len:272 (-) Transcript_123585:957-1772(-)